VMIVYSLLLLATLVLGSPYWLFRMATSGRYRAGFAGRFGIVPKKLRAGAAGRNVVWVHAVSVGEVLAATRLVAELEAELGDGWLVEVSTTTATGQALARERFGTDRVGADRVGADRVESAEGLTPREAEVLTHIAAGESNAEIAAALVVSEATVKTHINHIFSKTGLRDRAQLVGYAFRNGLAFPR